MIQYIDNSNDDIANANMMSPGDFLPYFHIRYVNMTKLLAMNPMQPSAKLPHKYPWDSMILLPLDVDINQ